MNEEEFPEEFRVDDDMKTMVKALAASEQFANIIAIVVGYRARAIDAGLPEDVADQMILDLHETIHMQIRRRTT